MVSNIWIIFHFISGMSSFPLTFIRGVGIPPTRLYYIYTCFSRYPLVICYIAIKNGLFFRPKFQWISPQHMAKNMVLTYLHQLVKISDLIFAWWRVLGAHLPTWQNRFLQDLLFRGRGSPGPLVYPVSNVAMENPMENAETQWMFFFWGKTMGKSRKIHCQWRFEWENHGKI